MSERIYAGMDNECYADALKSLMSEISEDTYCAGWMNGLEYNLWYAKGNVPRQYGMDWINSEHCRQLYILSELAGGWHTINGFMPMEEWLAHLKEYHRNV